MSTAEEILTDDIWDFVRDERAMGAVQWAARKLTRKFAHVEYDDAYMDVVEALAKRPYLHELAETSGNYGSLGQNLYRLVSKSCIAESNRRNRTVYTDAYEWEEPDR